MEVFSDGETNKNINKNKSAIRQRAAETYADLPERAPTNPIIVPVKAHPWEARATFNPTAIELAGEVHIL